MKLKSVYFAVVIFLFNSVSIYAQNGTELYQQRCAMCHDNAEDYTPPKSTFSFRSAQFVVSALTEGAMQAQAQGLSSEQIVAIAEHVTGKSINADGESLQDAWDINYCQKKPKPISAADFSGNHHWNGWGRDNAGTRFQPEPGIATSDIPV